VSGFDPAALQSLDASLDDDSEVVEVEADELRRVAGAEVRRRCEGLKLASRIIGFATAASAELDDEEILNSMTEIMLRLSSLRHVGLALVGVDKDSPDFPSVFNAVTSAMLDVVTEEWKWRRIDPDKSRLLPSGLIARLLDAIIKMQPERFEHHSAGVDMATARRLCVLEAIPKLYSLVNLFDYYQTNPDAMVDRLLRAVVEQAEMHASTIASAAAPAFAKQAVLQRMYGVSVGLMCEVYKAAAYRDVLRLREMPELDRSVVIAQYEHLGGMKYDHVLDGHRAAMDRMLDTANIILESRQRSQ
jgi:hypothetical protein